jgi:hypothetical protein
MYVASSRNPKSCCCVKKRKKRRSSYLPHTPKSGDLHLCLKVCKLCKLVSYPKAPSGRGHGRACDFGTSPYIASTGQLKSLLSFLPADPIWIEHIEININSSQHSHSLVYLQYASRKTQNNAVCGVMQQLFVCRSVVQQRNLKRKVVHREGRADLHEAYTGLKIRLYVACRHMQLTIEFRGEAL